MVLGPAKYGVFFHRGCKKKKKGEERHRDDRFFAVEGRSSMIGFANDLWSPVLVNSVALKLKVRMRFLLTRDLNCKSRVNLAVSFTITFPDSSLIERCPSFQNVIIPYLY